MDYDNAMKGVLFRNKKKEADSHPDYKGSCEIDGKERWISAWINEKQDGSGKYMKLVFQNKDEVHHRSPAPKEYTKPVDKCDPFASPEGSDSGEIPF